MELNSNCEGCAVSVHLSEEEIRELFGSTMKLKSVKTVSEDEHKRRMDICKSCDQLVYNTTCKQCGCIIHVKAKLAGARCPYPYNSKWETA